MHRQRSHSIQEDNVRRFQNAIVDVRRSHLGLLTNMENVCSQKENEKQQKTDTLQNDPHNVLKRQILLHYYPQDPNLYFVVRFFFTFPLLLQLR